jgi:hypothetical protein
MGRSCAELGQVNGRPKEKTTTPKEELEVSVDLRVNCIERLAKKLCIPTLHRLQVFIF